MPVHVYIHVGICMLIVLSAVCMFVYVYTCDKCGIWSKEEILRNTKSHLQAYNRSHYRSAPDFLPTCICLFHGQIDMSSFCHDDAHTTQMHAQAYACMSCNACTHTRAHMHTHMQTHTQMHKQTERQGCRCRWRCRQGNTDGVGNHGSHFGSSSHLLLGSCTPRLLGS